jgi:asparagine synthetase B (glutamine-hydrolysing)
MCGFIFSKTKSVITEQALRSAERFIVSRGPDARRQLSLSDEFGSSVFLAHYLLDISGDRVEQPYFEPHDQDVILLFNGEIYNYSSLFSARSDTMSILPLFHKYHHKLGEELNGEFNITIYNRTRNTLDIFTDPFLTKPLFIGRTNDPGEFGVATYRSALDALGFNMVCSAQPNTHYSISFQEGSISITERFPIYNFSTSQFSQSFSDWSERFVEAVRRRATHGAHAPLVCLSSGYDSGAITQALNLLELPYHTFSIRAGENESILAARVRKNQKFCLSHTELPGLTKAASRRISQVIASEVEPFVYSHADSGTLRLSLSEDQGALGAFAIGELARRAGMKVSISGCGADEIISDYGDLGRKIYPHSEFGGLFPADLSKGFFPWKKFYGDTQRSYLFKEEIILGHHGIEGRYPFLDRDLVQAFLNLDPELKNREYKAPIANFLREHNYPFEPKKKRGFSPRADPMLRRIRRRLGLV